MRRTLCHAACRMRSRAPANIRKSHRQKARYATRGFGRRHAVDAWATIGVVTSGRRPIQKNDKLKPASGFPGAGVTIFRDDAGMLVICPTGQACRKKKIPARIEERYSLAYLRMKRPAGRCGPRAGCSTIGLCR